MDADQVSTAKQLIRFGPFEADLRGGELRKHGIKVKLQDLPFRLLVSLLERPGEVVTREELQAKLWPSGTFVDFERGLRTALNKLREALCDSAAEPRFIETIPRRGYRFLAEVEKSEPPRVEPAPALPLAKRKFGVVAVGVIPLLATFLRGAHHQPARPRHLRAGSRESDARRIDRHAGQKLRHRTESHQLPDRCDSGPPRSPSPG